MKKQAKIEPEEEKRIYLKEAVCRDLIAQEALRKGQTFDEAYNSEVTKDEEVEARLQEEGLGYKTYEQALDARIKFLGYWIEYFVPHIKDGSDTVPALK